MKHDPHLIACCVATIERYHMVSQGEGVVVGVSGGADSMALVHALGLLSGELGISLHIAHLNHMIRGAEADADEAFVAAAGEGLGVPVHVRRVDVPALARAGGITVEEAGRNARYQLFEDVACEHGLKAVALAHNADDDAETVLMRVIRGTGLRGLAGIPPTRTTESGLRVIRPFIHIGRSVIDAYCAAHGISFRTDSTNTDTSYTRNRVRNELLPLLERDYNPSVRQALLRLARNAAADDDCLNAEARRLRRANIRGDDPLRLARAGLAAAHDAVLSRVLMWACERTSRSGRDAYRANLESLLGLVKNGNTGDGIDLPGAVRAWLEPDCLVFEVAGCHGSGRRSRDWGPYELTLGEWPIACGAPPRVRAARAACGPRPDAPGEAPAEWLARVASSALGERVLAADAGRMWAVFDAASLEALGCARLTVRPPQAGDRMVPFGMGGEKLLSDLFTDAKVPRHARAATPVVECGGRVLFVGGLRQSALAPVGDGTVEVVVLAVSQDLRNSHGRGSV